MNRRLSILISICVGLGVFAFLGGSGLSRIVTFQLLLRQEAPSEVALFETITLTPKSQRLLQKLWDVGKIPHRHLAIKYIHQRISDHPDEFAIYEGLIDEAVSDADFANRELAMGILDAKAPEKRQEVVLRGLRDPDQGTRLRALQFIKTTQDTKWMPELARIFHKPVGIFEKALFL